MSWCMSMPYSKKAEAGLLLLEKAEAMHVDKAGGLECSTKTEAAVGGLLLLEDT